MDAAEPADARVRAPLDPGGAGRGRSTQFQWQRVDRAGAGRRGRWHFAAQ